MRASSAPFRSTIAWETRKWLPWETFLYTAMQKPALGVALLAVLLPVSIIILPLMPLITLLTLSPPPEPSGPHAVGISDCCLPLPARDTSLRLRIFYPSAPHVTERGRSSWLPPGKISGRYATGHGEGLPFPKRVRSLLGPYMTWALRFARLPRRVVRDAPPATAMVGGWPLVVFSHGLYGCAASYSGLCAEMASHGSVVIALEHKDGSAVYTETDDGHSLGYTAPEKVDGRELQQDQRVEEVCSVLESIDEVAAKVVAGSGGNGDATLQIDRLGVSLVGHSFGSSTAFRVAAALEEKRGTGKAQTRLKIETGGVKIETGGVNIETGGVKIETGGVKIETGGVGKLAEPPRVRAVIALDPWISGYDCATHGAASVPTLAVMTQSMMWPPNEIAIGRVMSNVTAGHGGGGGGGGGGACTLALMAEAQGVRHQDVSDFPSLQYRPMQFFCMTGNRPPHAAHRQQTSLAVGFLALVGMLRAPSGTSLATSRDLTRSMLLTGGEGVYSELEPRGTVESWTDDYWVHGSAAPAEYIKDNAMRSEREQLSQQTAAPFTAPETYRYLRTSSVLTTAPPAPATVTRVDLI